MRRLGQWVEMLLGGDGNAGGRLEPRGILAGAGLQAFGRAPEGEWRDDLVAFEGRD